MNLHDVVMAEPDDSGSTRAATHFGSCSNTGSRRRLESRPPIVDAATIAKLMSSPIVPSPLGGRSRRSAPSSSGLRNRSVSLGSPGGKQVRSPLFRQVFKRYESRSPHPVTYRRHQHPGVHDEPLSASDERSDRSSSVLRDRVDKGFVRVVAGRDQRSNSPEFNSYLVVCLERDVEIARRKYQKLRGEEFKVSNELDEYMDSPIPAEAPRFLEYLMKKEQAVLASRSAHNELSVLARRLKRARIASTESSRNTGGPLTEIRSPHSSLPNGTISRGYFKDSYLNVLNAIRE